MRRRTVTALLATGLAGCLASGPSESNASTGTPAGTDTSRGARSSPPTHGPSDTSTTDPDETPPPPGDSTFADTACPPVLDACYHQATAESRAYVRPSTEGAPLRETVEFTLANRSGASLFFGPYHWQIWRREGGRWVDHSPAAKLDLGHSLEPAGSYTWSAVVDPQGGEVWPGDRSAEGATVELPAGRYAFGIAVDAESGDDAESLGTVGCLFEVTEG